MDLIRRVAAMEQEARERGHELTPHDYGPQALQKQLKELGVIKPDAPREDHASE